MYDKRISRKESTKSVEKQIQNSSVHARFDAYLVTNFRRICCCLFGTLSATAAMKLWKKYYSKKIEGKLFVVSISMVVSLQDKASFDNQKSSIIGTEIRTCSECF